MKVIRKDGIQYERDKDRDKKYDCSLNIRFERSELEKALLNLISVTN